MRIIFYFLLFTFAFLQAQEQRELIFGTSSSPNAVDTLNTAGDDTLGISRQIIFKGPKIGLISLYGKRNVLSGSDTNIVISYRELGSVYDADTLAIWSQYDTLGTIADGDSTFFFQVANPTSFKESDGIEYKFDMDAGGSRSIEIRAITKIK